MRKIFVSALLFCGIITAAFAQEKPLKLNLSNPVSIVTKASRVDFCVHVADTWQARQTGLMFQTKLPEFAGMLFDFGQDAPRSFWMKNTILPLDIIFIGQDGVIKSIAENTKPFSLDLIPSDIPARYVLEVNAGTVEKMGFKIGDSLEASDVKCPEDNGKP